MQAISYTLSDIDAAAAALWEAGKAYAVWSFAGDMGAGKTTLIAAICHHLKVEDAVSSPTYAIVNEYQFQDGAITKTIYHCDWYRLKDANEARDAGIEECLYQPNAYSFIEWASIAPGLLDKPFLKIEIEVLSEGERVARLSV